mmetsp:Transcript_36149/g.53004  ORF Transcript_36149/g.53004 Transcript_36149/m.53004 type:complete len:111 (-) Transcript_36149:839-1171(-)
MKLNIKEGKSIFVLELAKRMYHRHVDFLVVRNSGIDAILQKIAASNLWNSLMKPLPAGMKESELEWKERLQLKKMLEHKAKEIQESLRKGIDKIAWQSNFGRKISNIKTR